MLGCTPLRLALGRNHPDAPPSLQQLQHTGTCLAHNMLWWNWSPRHNAQSQGCTVKLLGFAVAAAEASRRVVSYEQSCHVYSVWHQLVVMSVARLARSPYIHHQSYSAASHSFRRCRGDALATLAHAAAALARLDPAAVELVELPVLRLALGGAVAGHAEARA